MSEIVIRAGFAAAFRGRRRGGRTRPGRQAGAQINGGEYGDKRSQIQ